MNKFTRSNLFLPLLGLFLCIQFLFGRLEDEPYPSILLPLFAGTPNTGNTITIKRLEGLLISESDTLRLTYEDLLPQVGSGTREFVLNQVFENHQSHASESTLPASLQSLFRRNLKPFISNPLRSQLIITWKELDIDVRTHIILNEQILKVFQLQW